MQSPKIGTIVGAVLALLVIPPVVAQNHGSGGGGGCGDVFGDLVHILRDLDTGQPILQKRWVELPGDTYDWGYCPIAVDASGGEIPFAKLSCDPLYPEEVVEVDYFGRLNGGRTKVRNQRMHFNEVIANIKASCFVTEDETGRLKFGFCDELEEIASWAIVDSPMESMGLYVRLMKFGHIQTDPMEEDTWAHGDPATMPQYQPALGPEDWPKFDKPVEHLLPDDGKNSEDCFLDPYFCAQREPLTNEDLVRAAAFMAGAANKTGEITDDLTQYFNRIVKITLDTDASDGGFYPSNTLNTLPALTRVCPTNPTEPLPGLEPGYSDECTLEEAVDTYPSPANERFVDFSVMDYKRKDYRKDDVGGVFPTSLDSWAIFESNDGVDLLDWLEYRNGPTSNDKFGGIDGFVGAAADSLRSIEFVHNYAIPEDLGVFCATKCEFPEVEVPLE